MTGLLHQLRYGLRQLRKSPAFTAIAVITLALGIGANTAIFSILDPLLVRKLPVQRPGELVRIGAAGSLGPLEICEVEAFYTYREKSQVFSGVFAFAPVKNYDVVKNNQTATAGGEIVSGNYFTVLGVHPFAGRLLLADDERGTPVAVLSFSYWKRAFGSDPTIVGKTLPLDNFLYTVVGIAPPEFFGLEVGKSPDLYLPLATSGPTRAAWVQIFGRLKPGVSIAQAQAGIEPFFREVVKNSSLPKVEVEEWMTRPDLTDASRGLSELRTQFSMPVRILMAVVGLILLIACANVANLMLSRSITRRKELSLKQALGSGRWRLVRQLLTESILLIVLGTTAGLLAGQWTSSFLINAVSSERLPVTMAAGINGRVLLFAAIVLGITILFCGLAPALSATRIELAGDLKVQEGGSALDRPRFGNLLVIAQVALSVIVLAGASLLLHSLVNLETFDVGFDRDHVLLVSIPTPQPPNPSEFAAFGERLMDRAKNLPGVRSVSYSTFSPISRREMGVNVAVEGHAPQPVLFAGISSAYFATLGIPLLQGRDFKPQEMQVPPRVAIVNHSMARRFFGNENPIGKYFKLVEGNFPPVEIVGEADSKYIDLRESAVDFFYLPSAASVGTLEVRTSGSPPALAASLNGLVRSLDSGITALSVKTMSEQIDESLRLDRLITVLCGGFALLALVLTGVGLFATLSFRVVRRTREIGIRMSLGARRGDVFRLVVVQGIVLTLIGALVGAAGAVAATSLTKSLLFNVTQSDPLTLVAVPVLLFIATILACYIPARRAATVDPMVALRYE